MRTLLPAILSSTLLLGAAGCAPTAQGVERQAAAEAGARAALDRELVGLVAGPPQNCVRQTELRDMRSFGETLVYEGAGKVRYVNHTSGGCGRVGEDNFLVTRTPSTQLCRGDIATAVDRNSRFPMGSCSYGEFVPYSQPR